MKHLRTIAVVSGLLSIASNPLAAAKAVDFNLPGDLASNFSLAMDTGTAASESATAGFNGTRGVDLSGVTENHGWIIPQSFSGDLASWSTSILWNTQSASNSAVTLGFVAVDDPFFTGRTPVTVEGTANLNNVVPSIYAEFSPNGQLIDSAVPGSVTEEAIDTHTLSVNTWYHLEIDASYNGSNSYSLAATTSSVNSSGTPLSTITSSSATFTNADIANDSQVYTYFGLHQNTGYVDNFSTTAIPEPSSYALLTSILAFFSCAVSRRRSK